MLFPKTYIDIWKIKRNDKVRVIITSSQSLAEFNMYQTHSYLQMVVTRTKDKQSPIRKTAKVSIPKYIVQQLNLKVGDEIIPEFLEGTPRTDIIFNLNRCNKDIKPMRNISIAPERIIPTTVTAPLLPQSLAVESDDVEDGIVGGSLVTPQTQSGEVTQEREVKFRPETSMLTPDVIKRLNVQQNRSKGGKKFIIRGGKRIEVVQNIL